MEARMARFGGGGQFKAWHPTSEVGRQSEASALIPRIPNQRDRGEIRGVKPGPDSRPHVLNPYITRSHARRLDANRSPEVGADPVAVGLRAVAEARKQFGGDEAAFAKVFVPGGALNIPVLRGKDQVVNLGRDPARNEVVIGYTMDIDSRGGKIPTGKVEEDNTVSKAHAQITVQKDGRVYVADVGSTNGTFVNGKRIKESVWLNVGDVIRMGRTEVEFKGIERANEESPGVGGHDGASFVRIG